jgi:hypothetical protein
MSKISWATPGQLSMIVYTTCMNTVELHRQINPSNEQSIDDMGTIKASDVLIFQNSSKSHARKSVT